MLNTTSNLSIYESLIHLENIARRVELEVMVSIPVGRDVSIFFYSFSNQRYSGCNMILLILYKF